MDFQEVITSPEVIWFIGGLVMLAIELFGGMGLTIGFFGIGAWMTSIACMIQPDLDMKIQLLVFTSVSIVSLIALRRMIRRKFFDDDVEANDRASREELSDEYIGHTAEAETDFEPGKAGRVNFKGATWRAISQKKISKGEMVRITDIESITLYVEPKG